MSFKTSDLYLICYQFFRILILTAHRTFNLSLWIILKSIEFIRFYKDETCNTKFNKNFSDMIYIHIFISSKKKSQRKNLFNNNSEKIAK